uniref:DNA 3'-5' helicase n=1 Tax=mine drainage metagenome TaxID=410659 RepID=E6PZ68_9ZZZZ
MNGTGSAGASSLDEVLRAVFGFGSFRANQEDVCRAVVGGADALLVMPTGSGKSLCYQLPALARSGTALVVSPLIALMEDQAAKLRELGLSVARIHSGLDRAVSRQACVDYLAGSLQFLFIAPERLRVPGFPELLAKRKPTLIAIDEAHCISQWGHDFRPDYRMLGQYLPALRPAPVIALTATATPTVQRDIVTQLGMTDARKFIHGFRRENLAIEVAEVPMSLRGEMVCDLLAREGMRPAIVYAPSRKRAEELSLRLREVCSVAAYHAGMAAEMRDTVHREFQAGRLECVVATIAFGMGIDKADVRTVIHVALPATLEGYYQEIGRAGRDGQPSRAILMHSYADQRQHEFFLTRDYPPAESLERVYKALTAEAQPIEEIRARLNIEEEDFTRAMEKLYIHGGAEVDFGDNARRGGDGWKKPYARQTDYRREQIALVQRYVDGHECRMAALVLHFGDVEDGRVRCGVCDFCKPTATLATPMRAMTRSEERVLRSVLDALRNSTGKSLGRLQKEMETEFGAGLGRKELDVYLAALARAGLVVVEDAEWVKDGETILFRKASLTAEGERVGPGDGLEILMPQSGFGAGSGTSSGSAKLAKSARAKVEKNSAQPVELSEAGLELEQALKEWRSGVAKRLRIPAFLILHDRTLRAIAEAAPKNLGALAAVAGMGPSKTDKYGEEILTVSRGWS